MKKMSMVLGFVLFALSNLALAQSTTGNGQETLRLKLQSGVLQTVDIDSIETLEATVFDTSNMTTAHRIVTGSKIAELLSSIDFQNPWHPNGLLGCMRLGEMTLTFKANSVPAEFQPKHFTLFCSFVGDDAFKTVSDSVLYRTSRMLDRAWLEQ